MRSLAIIPARSGSKGLPDKNILPLDGKPMISYTIKAAQESGCFDTILVSTDSEKYAEIAKAEGAEVPFLRSAKSSSDTASSWDVVREVLNRLEDLGKIFDRVCLLQPTSPLRTGEDIKKAFELYDSKNAKTVVSVCESPHPMEWSFHLDESCSMDEYGKEPCRNLRRQDIPKRFIENGAIYLTSVDLIKDVNTDIYVKDCFAYVMEQSHSHDVDSALDMCIAEAILRKKL